MKKILRLQFLFIVFSCVLVVSACSSIQHDIIIYTQEEMNEIKDIELAVCGLDVADNLKTLNEKEFAKNCNDVINNINYSIKYMGQNNALRARLYALQGRIYLMQGKVSKAKDCYGLSTKSFRGETQSVILGFRLGLIEDIEDKDIVSLSGEKHLLVAEKALDYYKNGQYKYSVAYFDKAFLEMDQSFVDCYMTIRNNAWKLKELENVTDDKVINQILNKQSIKSTDMLLLTQEVSDLLLAYNHGKQLKEDALYKLCNENNLLTSSSAVETQSTALKTEEVTRLICARFLWNLLNQDADNMALTKYSRLYRNSNRKSPIADIEITDRDFDAVLGCVENEIINLTDGRNFAGNDKVSGYDAYLWIKKAEAVSNE